MNGRLAAKSLGTTDTSVIQVASEGSVVIHAIYLVNSTSSMKRIRLHHCRNGEESGLGNAMLYDAAIAPYSTLLDDTRLAMAPGDELRARASDTGLSILVEGTALP